MDFRQLAHALWRYRSAIVITALFGVVTGLGLAYLSTRFVSSGLFLTPGLNIATYKQYEVAFDNEPRVEEFVRFEKLEGTEAASLLRRLVQNPGAMAQAIRPAFSVTGRDAKIYDIQPAEGQSGDLVGIRLTMERAEKNDIAPVLTLAEYVRSTIILIDLREQLLDYCLGFQLKERQLRNEQIKSDFELTQLVAKADNLRHLIESMPGAAAIDNRQVVSLENGGERYLAPTAQLVAVEVAMSDVRLAVLQRDRERVSALLKKDYFCRARNAIEKPMIGPELLPALAQIRLDVFSDQDLKSDAAEQAANEIDLQRQAWSDRYLDRMRFVVSPEGAEVRVRTPSLRIGVLIGGVVGSLLGILLALFLAWWHDNRNVVMARDDA